jgi:hypothetical protein
MSDGAEGQPSGRPPRNSSVTSSTVGPLGKEREEVSTGGDADEVERSRPAGGGAERDQEGAASRRTWDSLTSNAVADIPSNTSRMPRTLAARRRLSAPDDGPQVAALVGPWPRLDVDVMPATVAESV